MIKFDVKTHLDTQKLKAKTTSARDAAQMQLDQDVLKDSNFYIPKETGELERSGIRHTRIGSGKVIWKTPYARYQYYGVDFNFSHDVNPFARALWFEAAKKSRKRSWLRDMKKKYRKFFDGR